MPAAFKVRWDNPNGRCPDNDGLHESGRPYIDPDQLREQTLSAGHMALDALWNWGISDCVHVVSVGLDGCDAGGATYEVTLDGPAAIVDDLGAHIQPLMMDDFSIVM